MNIPYITSAYKQFKKHTPTHSLWFNSRWAAFSSKMSEQYPFLKGKIDYLYNCEHRVRLQELTNLQLFFDFYSIVQMYNKTVGTEIYLNKDIRSVKILPFAKEQKIRQVYEDVVNRFYKAISEELTYAVYREARHISDYSENNDKFDEAFQTFRDHNKSIKLPRDYTLDNLEYFYDYFEWSDDSYGGKAWGNGVKVLKDLLAARTLEEKIYTLDRVMDLEHNTGHILNKRTWFLLSVPYLYVRRSASSSSKINQTPLDYRFYATLPEMIEICSPEVRSIYFANKNHFTMPTISLPKTINKKAVKKKVVKKKVVKKKVVKKEESGDKYGQYFDLIFAANKFFAENTKNICTA